ncbi:MAG: SH3 domain-containing protein [Lachnospiraceae bacterium]|nr:SH3 domain-containing protein [Lachnospiraceae bacterium]MDD3795818.1 SH3 domain-containing protein [Lachnospiraceae bacterium]
MKSFKEWLSDNLRYIILVLIVLLAIGGVILGLELYQNSQNSQVAQNNQTANSGGQTDNADIVIYTESQSEKVTEKQETETKSTSPSSETSADEKGETLLTSKSETESGTGRASGQTQNAGNATQGSSNADTASQTGSTSASTEKAVTETTAPVTETQAPTEPETEVYQPVYMTMTGACYIRSYADYGDNIIGEYPAGTVVEFLEDVGGWYKVQIDGMVGYMGARFFN